MRVLMFHGILAAEAREFEITLTYLAGKFSIVPLVRIVDRVLNGEDARGTEMALTFDDGLMNNYLVVYPILKRLGLPATFFVCPSLVDSGAWLWNQEVRARLSAIPDRWNELFTRLEAPAKNPDTLVEWMKTMDPGARAEAEASIRCATNAFTPTKAQRELYDLMGWAQLQELDPKLISIGSHSATHPILTNLTDEDIESEMAESRRMLEEKLQRQVDIFCYPNGAYDSRCLRAARRFFRAAWTTATGFVNVGDDPYQLARIPGTCDAALMAWRLYRPEA
jgi:peptidoglycan/xylan/chitin deacetylase (PgdA/CDA1 family)